MCLIDGQRAGNSCEVDLSFLDVFFLFLYADVFMWKYCICDAMLVVVLMFLSAFCIHRCVCCFGYVHVGVCLFEYGVHV